MSIWRIVRPTKNGKHLLGQYTALNVWEGGLDPKAHAHSYLSSNRDTEADTLTVISDSGTRREKVLGVFSVKELWKEVWDGHQGVAPHPQGSRNIWAVMRWTARRKNA